MVGAGRFAGDSLVHRLSMAAVLAVAGAGAVGGAVAEASRGVVWQAAQDLSAGAPEAGQREPDLLTMTDGSLWAIWVDDRLGPGVGLWSAVKPPEGAPWQEVGRVTSLDGAEMVDGTVLATPRLAEDPWGRLHAVWLRRQAEGASVWHAYRRPGWAAWSLAERIDSGVDTDRADPDLTADRYGNLHAVWSEGRAEADIVHAVNTPGVGWSLPARLNNPAAGVQRRPVLTAAPDGNVYAAWVDTREGRSDIAASRLPPGGDVWWPNANLSADAGPAAHVNPAIAIDEAGHPVVAWLELSGRGRIRAASLPEADGFWRSEGLWYEARLGFIEAVDLVAGSSGSSAVFWTEGRDDETESRLYGALVDVPGPVTTGRVDAARGLSQARDPRATVDREGRVQVVWVGRRAGEPGSRILGAASDVPLSPSASEALVGRLLYVGLPVGCPMDAYALVDCDGQWLTYVRAAGPALAPFLGSWVKVTGGRDSGTACRPLRAEALQLQGGPCPRNMAIATGVLSLLKLPVDNGHARLGDARANTGPMGRYALALGGPGRADLTVGAPCALDRRFIGVDLIDGLNQLPDIQLRAGDVDGNCEVDLRDLVQVARQQGLIADLASPRCIDLDRDGRVSLLDLAPVAAAYGSRCVAGLELATAPAAATGPTAAFDPGMVTSPAGPASPSDATAPSDTTAPSDPTAPLGPTQSVGATSSPGTPLRWLGGAARVWRIEMGLAAGTPLVDQDETRPGLQPFSVGWPGAAVLENRMLAEGRVLLEVARLGAATAPSEGAPLAMLGGGAGVVDWQIEAADDDGRWIRGGLGLGSDVYRRLTLWLPSLGGDLRRSPAESGRLFSDHQPLRY